MDNPEKLENIGYTRHRKKTNKTKNTTQKTKTMSATNHTNTEMNPGAIEGQFLPHT